MSACLKNYTQIRLSSHLFVRRFLNVGLYYHKLNTSVSRANVYRNIYSLYSHVRNSFWRVHFSADFSASALDVNVNVAKDVILYQYENPKFYRIINIFALSQFGFWAYLSHFAFTSLKDAPVPEEADLPWWRQINLGENKYRNSLAVLSFLVGYGILTAAWLYTLKSVRFLILRKGGEQLTFVTYTPFGKNRMMTVPLDKVSSEETRHAARVQLPIKVKGHRLFYVLDMKGEFKNGKLFDCTAGLKRIWKD